MPGRSTIDLLHHLEHAFCVSSTLAALTNAVVNFLSQGSWDQIQSDHAAVGLEWHPELEPGWGKPKYVRRVLSTLSEHQLRGLARRCLENLHDRPSIALENARWTHEDVAEPAISRLTRKAITQLLDGKTFSLGESPGESMAPFDARPPGGLRASAKYDERGQLVQVALDLGALFGTFGDPSNPNHEDVSALTHEAFLNDYDFMEWPTRRLSQFLARLVHPETRQGNEQADCVEGVNDFLRRDGFQLAQTGEVSGHAVFEVQRIHHGVGGRPKNLIFAADGPKPELGFRDAINNDIVILKHAEYCLVYDEPIGTAGLSWWALGMWWAKREGLSNQEDEARKLLGARLLRSLGSEAERGFFKRYFKSFADRLDERLPALIPQVYLHYDPKTISELKARGDSKRFAVQRMDFLMLLPDRVRVVIEIDGKQHYSTDTSPNARPSPEVYAETVRGDRELRLAGYEVYRFGGYECGPARLATTLEAFFSKLFERHSVR